MPYNNPLSDKIHHILTPLLGSMMADATLRVQCKKIGTSAETLSTSSLSDFAKNLEMGLVIFVGSEKAKEVSWSIEHLAF